MVKRKSKMKQKSLRLGYIPPADAEPPLIAEGEYSVECVGLNTTSYHSHLKLCLYFELLCPPSAGLILTKFYNYGYDPFPRSSDYFQGWVIAAGKRPGSRNKANLHPRVFYKKTFNIRVVTVKPKNKDGSTKPDALHYSKVGEVLSLASVGSDYPKTDPKFSLSSAYNSSPVTYNQDKGD